MRKESLLLTDHAGPETGTQWVPWDPVSALAPSSPGRALPAHSGAKEGRLPTCEMVTWWHRPCLETHTVGEPGLQRRAQHRAGCHSQPSSLPTGCIPVCIPVGDAAASASPSWHTQRASRWHSSSLGSLVPCQRPPEHTSTAGNSADCKNLGWQGCNSLWLTAWVVWCPGEVLWSCHTWNDNALTQHSLC